MTCYSKISFIKTYHITPSLFQWQAPEQYNQTAPLSEKADVYSLGNVLYFLLAADKPFPDMEPDEAFRYIGNGEKLEIKDPAILNSTHPFHVHVMKAMEMCLEHDPAKRPDARNVREFLKPHLAKFLDEKKEKKFKVVADGDT